MKINVTDGESVQDALDRVNGRARTHTFTLASNVAAEASAAESVLLKHGVAKCDLPGATAEVISGDRLPKRYKYNSIRTKITLVRGSRHWYLTGVSGYEARPNERNEPVYRASHRALERAALRRETSAGIFPIAGN